jgi:large subunit ribosomal protein L22
MEAKATAKYLKGSPQKARLVIDLIRGRTVEEAQAILRFSRKRSAKLIQKVLRSAIANAEQAEPTVDVEGLVVTDAYVDLGPTKSRFRLRPAPQGRAFRQRRRQSHVTIRISDER